MNQQPNPNRTRRTLARTAAALAVGVLAVIAGPTAGAAVAPAEDPAWVRVAHLVPDLPTMDIWLTPFDGADDAAPMLQTSADYGRVKEYQPLATGLYAISIRSEGASASMPPLLTGTLRAEAGQAYTVAGLGDADDATVQVLDDNLTLPEPGQSRIRLLPAASAAETVTVTAADGPTLAQDAAYAEPSGYAQVPAGPWQLDVTTGGGSLPDASTDVDLDAGSVYTLLVLDTDDGLEITAVVDAAGTTVTPVGGAQTGGGGLSTSSSSASASLVAAGALALATGGVVLLRRRTP